MTAKEYLMQLETLSAAIKHKEQEMKAIEWAASGIRSPSYEADKVQTFVSDGKIADVISEMQRLELEVMKQTVEYMKLKHKIIDQINSLGDSRYLTVLHKRYVEGKSLYRIAAEMNYNYTWLCELHGKALLAFDKKYLTPEDTRIT